MKTPKTDRRFCAHTKFKKVCLAVQGDLKLTIKTMTYIQTLVDNLMQKFFRLIYNQLQNRKTIKTTDLSYLVQILEVMGFKFPKSDYVKYLPKRIGYHILKQMDIKLRISKEAQEQIQRFYINCTLLIINHLQESFSKKDKRITPEMVTNSFQGSNYQHLLQIN